MLKTIRLAVIFLCMLWADNAYAIIDTGPAINGTPSQFAIYALEDIFTYDTNNREAHFNEMKDAYFSEEGWTVFKNVVLKDKGFFSGKIERNALAVYEFWLNQDEDRDDYGPNQSGKEKVAAEFSGDFSIILMDPESSPKNRMNIKGKYVFRPIIKVKISGVRDPDKKYGSHYMQGAPAYNYKIESIEFIKRTEK